MSFDKQILKSLLIRDKAFIRSLYDGPNPLKNRRLLNGASESQLNTLIKFIYYVCNGQISIDALDFQSIKKKRKLSFLKKNFENKTQVVELLYKELQFKKQLLLQLSTIYPNLLATLFILPNKAKHGL